MVADERTLSEEPRALRPPGVSSRIIRAAGVRHPWTVGDVVVDLPVVIDWVETNGEGSTDVRIEATIDLVAGTPEMISMTFQAPNGLDIATLQREFRWASPLHVVTGLMPAMLEEGIDPFDADLPTTGFPSIATGTRLKHPKLSDEFLTTIAREYTVRGRGYAASLAEEYCVSPRTVVSWIEKARDRGLLTRPPTRGAVGGSIKRPHDRG